MVSRQCILVMELKDIGRKKIDGSLAKRQICQCFLPSCYTVCTSQFYLDTYLNILLEYIDVFSLLRILYFHREFSPLKGILFHFFNPPVPQ